MAETGNLNYHSLDSLLAAYPQGGVTFLVRHAERHPFNTPQDVFQAGLTANGFQQARRFGESLSGKLRIGVAASSPLERCVDTVKCILAGAGIEKPVRGYWWLFSPFLRSHNGVAEGVQFWPPQPAEKPDATYLKNRLEVLARRIQTPLTMGEIYLYISHDTTILPMLGYLLGRTRVEFHQMPGYLEGIILVHRDGKLCLDDPDRYT
jgi:broad specificity phosphatase PhoE